MRVGSLVYATEQGLGRLGKSFYDAGIIDEVLIASHSSRKIQRSDWYPADSHVVFSRNAVGPEVDAFLDRIDIFLFFETPFDWSLLNRCKERNVKTILMPMYEWYPQSRSRVAHRNCSDGSSCFDFFLNPSLLDQNYFPDGEFLPVPVVDIPWQQRTRAKRFLHNSGNIGSREHKGTFEVLLAVQHLQSPAQITVRSQQNDNLRKLVEKSEVDTSRINIEYGGRPYETLWDDHDVLLAPEKYNGLSLPLQEARAAGLVVMASDRYPVNTWLPKEPLIPVSRVDDIRVQRSCVVIERSIIEPKDVARKIDEWYDRDISEYSLSGKTWADEMSWDNWKSKYMEILERVHQF